jgi:methionyl-tRNA formyltransferase
MNHVLVTSREWNESLAKRLEEKTGYAFQLITRSEELTYERLQAISPRYVFFPHWSHIIPSEIHEAFECVIFHMTDLPYGRGGSPLQNLILRGYQETQISALRCVAELDAGPIYMKRPLSLEGSASEIFLCAADVVQRMIEEIVRTEPLPEPQEGEPTIFRRRTLEQSNLREGNFLTLKDFFDFIRMLDAPTYPLAFIEHEGFLLEFSHAQLLDNSIEARVTIRRKGNMQ